MKRKVNIYQEHCKETVPLKSSLNSLRIYLVVKHEQDGAANTHVTGPLHLETISLLGGGSPMPLNKHRKNIRNR